MIAANDNFLGRCVALDARGVELQRRGEDLARRGVGAGLDVLEQINDDLRGLIEDFAALACDRNALKAEILRELRGQGFPSLRRVITDANGKTVLF